jgi:uncharacterized RDD family membrane protein YckC
MLPENDSFLIRGEDGEEYGPVDLEELREWVRENRAGLGTEVRRDEPGASWNAWQNYPELIALLAEVHAGPGPTPGPEGLTIAPIWRRALAWAIDILLLAILLNPLQVLLDHVMPMHEILEATANPALLQTMPTPMLYQVAAFIIIYNGCLVLYFAICHAVYGRTPAKALLRIRVVDPSGQKPAPVKAFVRALALVFSVNLIFPLAYAFMNPQRRAFHDLVAGTCVVDS